MPADIGQPDVAAVIDEEPVGEQEGVGTPAGDNAPRRAFDAPDRRLANRAG